MASKWPAVGRALGLTAACIFAAALAVGLGSGAVPREVQATARTFGVLPPAGRPTISADAFAAPGADQPPAVPNPALSPVSQGQPVDPELVAQRINEVADTGGEAAVVVQDGLSGAELYSERGDASMIPASTLKLVIAAAALEAFGSQHRFSTEVVIEQPPTSPDPTVSASAQAQDQRVEPPEQIVLVGGGDPYLGSSQEYLGDRGGNLDQLAQETAAALQEAGADRVDIAYDTGLFAGPDWHPSWPDGYRSQVTPVSSLWVDGGYADDGRRPTDPAQEAANTFADRLSEHGVEVGAVDEGEAPAQSTAIAAVESMPLQLIVERLNSFSDNNATEVLLRQLGTQGDGDGSFSAGARETVAVLEGRDIATSGLEISDGSGLSRDNRLTAQTLVEVIELGLEDEATFRPLVTGMSVAGAEGTLRQRFVEDGTAAGRGEVRAKTGTLRQVHTLAGYVVTADQSVLVYALLLNGDAPENDYDNRVWLDRVSAALAGCGCS